MVPPHDPADDPPTLYFCIYLLYLSAPFVLDSQRLSTPVSESFERPEELTSPFEPILWSTINIKKYLY